MNPIFVTVHQASAAPGVRGAKTPMVPNMPTVPSVPGTCGSATLCPTAAGLCHQQKETAVWKKGLLRAG